MMKFALIFTTALLLMPSAMAQSLSSAWTVVSPSQMRPIKINTAVTSNCQAATNNAAAAWNGTRATIVLQTPTTTSTRIPALTSSSAGSSASTEAGVINIQDEPSTTFGSAIMRTAVLTSTTSQNILDANIYVRADYLYYATTAGRASSTYTTGKGYDCPSPASNAPRSNHFDYQTAMTHELGHALGFAESTSGSSCPMFQTLGVGQSKRTICASEKDALVFIYGTRP
jgi:hypothetical protein